MRLDRQLAREQLVGQVEQVHGRSVPPARRLRKSSGTRLRKSGAIACRNRKISSGDCLRPKSERVPIPIVVTAVPDPETAPEGGALARSQAARRRRVLDATLQLAAEGGFDAVQMRDVAAAADVALGTVYRYFASKERLLLEAMAEQQADLRAYLDVHPPREPTPAARVVSVLRGANRSLREFPDVTAAMVRSFGTAQIENADIVRRVTEIMTGIITSAIHAPERRAGDRARGAGRAHPHAGVALVAERLGVRRRRARPGRRRPRRRRRPPPRLAGLPLPPGAHTAPTPCRRWVNSPPRERFVEQSSTPGRRYRGAGGIRKRVRRWHQEWNVFYFRPMPTSGPRATSTSPTCSSSPSTRCPTASPWSTPAAR